MNFLKHKFLKMKNKQELFSNAGHYMGSNDYTPGKNKKNIDLCYYNWDNNNNLFYNTITNTYPSIIQTPGKNWDCYKFLAKKLIDKPERPVPSNLSKFHSGCAADKE